MILGMPVHVFTVVHVVISLIAIVSGLIVLFGMLKAQRLGGWTALFLLTTILTSVTGFLFPIHGFTPALGTGIVSLAVLAIALIALYAMHLAGAWRWIYVATAVAALYFNVLVLIVQAFQTIGVLKALAPTQSEAPFLVVQTFALLFFVIVGTIAASNFRPARS